ncbi:MAG: HipA domain-containing protein [Acidobacteriota bacterium]|nr:HipA domain-containing protein [Acidobacteriota bacterium]
MTDRSVGGDAPKDFIHVYCSGTGRRDNPDTWPSYIAKVGHKWYPSESVTEQLMTRVGEFLGFRMAESRLMYSCDQIRFLSRYFLLKDESLVHGAEIVAGHLVDSQFVEDVGQQHLEKDIFTFQVLCQSIRTLFPDAGSKILLDFVGMIAFDALVGNQDRHLYNWGVIDPTRGAADPRFSPIFDTARGLFWNTGEAGLQKYADSKSLNKYVEAARPLIGWDGERDVNHFRLVRNIAALSGEYRDHLCALGNCDLAALGAMITEEFSRLLSRSRVGLIQRTLELRFCLYAKAVREATC